MADRIVIKEQTEADARATPCTWNGFRSPVLIPDRILSYMRKRAPADLMIA